MNNSRVFLATSIIVMLAPAVAAFGEAPGLKEIMQGLRDNVLSMSDGLLTDNFEQVALGAAAIAAHPQIPARQVQLVAAELGAEMAVFEQFDNVVHDVSLEIGAAVSAGDRAAAISGYQRMIEGCFACHDIYKERVAALMSSAK